MPYGSDVQDMSRSSNLLHKTVMAAEYPNHRFRRSVITSKIDLWTKYADHVIAGCEWVDYMYHWDTLMLAHFSIDTDLWKPLDTDNLQSSVPSRGKLRILHAPNHRILKGTQYFIDAIDELEREGLEVELILLERVSNDEVKKELASVDLVADQLFVGWYAMFALEAMASGRPVIVSHNTGSKDAVEDGVHVARLLAGPVVLDHLVGLEDVGADLVAPGDPSLLIVGLGGGRLPFGDLALVEFGFEHLEGGGPIPMLAPVALALDHDARGQVANADGRVGLVDVLTTRAAGAVRVHMQVFVPQLDLDLFVKDRGHIDSSEGRVSAAARVEGGDAHQPVHSHLALEIAVGSVTLDREGDTLQPSFLVGGELLHCDGIARLLKVAGVHPQQHLGPVAALRTPGSGLDLEIGPAVVVGTGEDEAKLELFQLVCNQTSTVIVARSIIVATKVSQL